MHSKPLLGSIQALKRHDSMRFLHRFSDSGLHTTLMIAIVLLSGMALYQAISFGVAVWQLEPVVVQGHAPKR